jgi:hypothetical protein
MIAARGAANENPHLPAPRLAGFPLGPAASLATLRLLDLLLSVIRKRSFLSFSPG